MRILRNLPAASLTLAALLACAAPAWSQQAQNPGFFIPPSQPAQPVRPAQPAPARPVARPAPVQFPPQAEAQPQGGPEESAELPQVPLPPVPELAALPKVAVPPAVTVGVLGVPEVMRASTAANQVQGIINDRRRKLAEDAQKEQAALRDLQQALATERAKLSADQIRSRERELQERITTAQRSFRDRNVVIQQAAQYGLAQIEQTLVAVIRQVAESHGMNLVLHRAQVALNVNDFDITDQVAEQLNKVLPSVVVPPEGADVATFARQQAQNLPGPRVSKLPAAAPPGPAAPPAPAAAPGPRVGAPAADAPTGGSPPAGK